jgi:hypothetical protein
MRNLPCAFSSAELGEHVVFYTKGYETDVLASTVLAAIWGHNGQRVAAFRLKLSAPSGQSVRVTIATANGSAISGDDYVALAPTQIAFTTGNLYAYARVLINGDVLIEPDETFVVNLSNPQNATITDNQAIGTIINDDASG